MDNPNWAESLGADAALWSAIFAGLYLVVAIIAGCAAIKALRWAKIAAKKAGVQASAALSAAKAAQDQVDLVRQEMEWNEPQPIIILSLKILGATNQPSLELENIGTAMAFDIMVSEIIQSVDPITAQKTAVVFEEKRFLKPNEAQTLVVKTDHLGPIAGMVRPGPLEKLFDALRVESITQHTPGPDGLFHLRQITVTCHNVRNKKYTTPFMLKSTHSGGFEIIPEWSLLPPRRP